MTAHKLRLMTIVVPEKPALEGLEEKWAARWRDEGTYKFDRTQPRENVFSIDTPPPTVSGKLHVGHVFSYTHPDLVARYQRMSGKSVFYPMGWDDNGLPTERRVQTYYGVRCDPSLPYDADFTPPENPDPKKQIPISRPNFVELCERLVELDEQVFEQLWRTLGLSVDWDEHYTTIGAKSQLVSQTAFLRNFARGEAYLQEAPTLWDVTFQTAVAQAELEAREYAGHYHRVAFHRADGAGRPHRDDAARADRLGGRADRPPRRRALPARCSEARSPRRSSAWRSRSCAHPAAEMDKGAGIAMCCTFGDLTDVTWWRELNLPVRTVIGRDGRFSRETPEWLADEGAAAAYADLAGKTVFSAREAMVAKLRETGDLDGEPTPTQRMANFYERGEKPLEIVATRQWYIKNGGRDAALRGEMLEHGAEIDWLPDAHEAPLRQLGRRPQRRLADLPAAVLRDPVPGLVPARRRRGARLRPPADAERGRAAGRPVDGRAAGLHRGPARQAGRLRRRPRRDGHLGDLVADPADRGRLGDRRRPVAAGLPDGPVHPGPRHHPHLAVRPGGARPPREPRDPVAARDAVRLDPRPGPQEDEQVQGQRRGPDRDPREVRRRRGPLAGRDDPTRARLAVRRDPDEGRSPARDEGAQRLAVRPRWRGRDRA